MIKSIDRKALDYKRVAIDTIYSMAVHCSDKISNQMPEILKILDTVRTDKNLPIRTSAQQTIKLLKEIQAS